MTLEYGMPYKESKLNFLQGCYSVASYMFQKQVYHNVVTRLSQGCKNFCKQACSNLVQP